MNPLPPPIPPNQDEDHLRLLTIFHYIVGGMIALFSCFALIHFVLGLSMVLSPQSFNSTITTAPAPSMPPFPSPVPFPAPPSRVGPPAFMGYMFMIIGGLVVVSGWTVGALTIYAGRCLKARRRYTVVFVMACVICLWMPIGTALGVCTILVLSRPTVKQMFEA